ncbi:class I SAM-dependent methyltransferase [Haloterrigena alkaliphila]|uniref:Methyltransferase domain-containing protein n=1 Tax=Haloterrigena alkaliphila TaxID=2816475 RepID=A0A8A2VG61_9EURY|nr:methyltransferase domain-containing protein [Haloterrigena alkaliphila]QSW99680.1 methyltransferase domain-containing protein [Haloterrigena alkaliphila]
MVTDRRDRTPTADPPATDDDHADHLERSRTVWDRWSDWYGMSEKDFEPIREAAIDRLDLQRGDRVLEIGCGPGVNFERVRRDIGAEGELVAVDYSPGMLENARERIEAHGWENVRVLRADATTVEFDEPFDAALATLSLSVMPDVRRAAETVSQSLVPGARLAVVDVRPFPSGPARVLNPFVRRFLRWYANWNPDDDVAESLDDVFDTCELVDTHFLGTAYTAVCGKRDAA